LPHQEASKRYLLPFLFLLCALSLSIWSATTDELIAQAHTAKLSESRYWHLLMHAPHEESEIDDEAFFIAEDGKNNLVSELDMTIRHFNDDDNRTDESVFCRFPARRAWLENELNVSFGEGECTEYNTLIEKMDPQKVTLVFPTAHINSPASMFGHTFLRIDSSMDSKLMSYAINYAAQTDETSGWTFAYKGIFGGYNGYYSMLPYYEKLKEYRDSESRDVWEYDLNLTHDEVMAMVRHIWELQRISSQYYFFDENCSYHMLWLTEIARPSVHLRDHFTYHVIPPETVIAFEEENIVETRHYRPSKRTKLLAYEQQLTPESIKVTKLLASGEMKAQDISSIKSTDAQKRYILEGAAELVEYDYIDGKLSKEVYSKRYHELLTQRAVLGQGEALFIAEKPNPDTAHHAARITIGQGWDEERSPFLIGWRPAYHDLSEDDTGHLSGAQIEFFDLLLGVEDSKVDLEKLTLLSLASITPVSQFFKPLSWRMKTGWDRDYGDGGSSFVARVGAGSAIGNENCFGYVLSEPEIRPGPVFDAGIGFTTGGAISWGARMKTLAEGSAVFYLNSDMLTKMVLTHQWQINSSAGLFVKMESNHQSSTNNRLKAGINFYF
jgi:hypothetical protein